jgi:hypothetical protein
MADILLPLSMVGTRLANSSGTGTAYKLAGMIYNFREYENI